MPATQGTKENRGPRILMSSILLSDAAQALEALAQGQEPNAAGVLAGAVALDAMQLASAWERCLDTRALVDAAQAMLHKAIAGELNLDAAEKAAAALASSISVTNS